MRSRIGRQSGLLLLAILAGSVALHAQQPGRDFTLRTVATGVITWPRWEASGPIIVHIMASEELPRTWLKIDLRLMKAAVAVAED